MTKYARHSGRGFTPPPGVSIEPGPRLQALMDAGSVWAEDGAYVGKASDGVIVQIGNVGHEDTVEMYLISNPTPHHW